MVQINSHTKYYWKKFDKKVDMFNKSSKLLDYFGPMMEGDTVRIAEVGCGLVNTIGDSWPNVDVHVVCSDINADSFNSMWEEMKKKPLHKIHKEDVEALSYKEGEFDIVHCRNALDHTADPLRAIGEFKRVAGRFVYLCHAERQRELFGGHHLWDVKYEDGKCYFYGNEYSFFLSDLWKVSFDGEFVHCIYEI